MISLAPVLGFSVLGIPSGDTQNTSDLGTGYPKLGDTQITVTPPCRHEREAGKRNPRD